MRRNLTDVPPTRDLMGLFMRIIEEISDLTGEDVVMGINRRLASEASNDEVFRKSLEGPVYSENSDVVRFILCSLEEKTSGKEKWDLWRTEKKYYIWTIEHILPQGKKLPKSWIVAIAKGDEKKASELQDLYADSFGNLTLTGYNSNLGNKSFKEKKDRKDGQGKFVGCRNGLHLNAELVKCSQWTIDQIEHRQKNLVAETLALFPLTGDSNYRKQDKTNRMANKRSRKR